MLSQISGAAQPSDVILDTKLRKEVENNEAKLSSIVDTVILCGSRGMALRRHRDDSQYHLKIGDYSTGQAGNFIDVMWSSLRG